MRNRPTPLAVAIESIDSPDSFFMKLNHDSTFAEGAILGSDDQPIQELNALKDKIPRFTHTTDDLSWIFLCLRHRYYAQAQILGYLANKLPSIINTPTALCIMLNMMHQYSPGCLGQPQYSSERKNIHEDFMDKLAGNLPWLLSIFPTPERFNQAINGGLSDLHPHQKVYLKEVLLPLIIKASEEKTDKMTAVVSENTQVKDASPKKDTSPKAVNRTLSSSSSTLLRAPVNAPAEQISPTPAATFEYGMGMGCSMQ